MALSQLLRGLCGLVFFSSLLSLATALPAHARSATVIKRQEDLLDEYDYIVAGAGTAGLTVADRLSESGDYTVLVVEYGYLDSSHSITAVATPDRGAGTDEYPAATRMYNGTSVPQADLDGGRKPVPAGAVVGGSSAVNGMFFDRGTAEDYDSWVWAAGKEYEEEFASQWGWDNMLPAFKKSVTFHPPTEEMQEAYGITYDVDAAYGGETPIHSSYRPFQWPAQQLMWNAFKEIPGIEFPEEGADGRAYGVFWCPNSMDPETNTRSYSKLGHYEEGPASRDNFHLLPAHRVTQVILTSEDDTWVTSGVRFVPRDGGSSEDGQEVKVNKEVVVSGGTFHTPQILERSGIGSPDILEAAGVEVKVDLPGVGWNLQDHMNYGVAFDFTVDVSPDSGDLISNSSFAAEAMELWEANKTGPYTAYVNSGAFLPLPVISNETETIISKLEEQELEEFLPEDLDESLIAGYAEQRKALIRQLRSTETAWLEMPFSGASFFSLVLLHCFSRGTVHISPDDDGNDSEPVVDYRSFSNPVDSDITVELLRGVRWFMSHDAMVDALGPVEMSPGADVTDSDDIKDFIRQRITPTTGHPIGTAALAPKELGGVVGPDLTVYGTKGLSVADNSIIPLLPGTHTSSTAYAIGEKAAELILDRA